MKQFSQFFKEQYLILESIQYTDRTLFKRIINEEIQGIDKQQLQNLDKANTKSYLDDDTQIELIKKYKQDPNSKQGLDARNKVIQNKYKWISILANKAKDSGKLRPEHVQDAIQNAVVSMINGIEKYDPEKGVPFTGYIKDWIMAGIINPFNPVRQRSISADTQGRDGTSVASIDAPASNTTSDDKELTIGDKIADGNQGVNPYDVLDNKDVRRKLATLLHKLPEKQAKAIRLKFFTPGPNGKQKTDEQIGKVLGMTKMGVKYLIDRAITKLTKLAESQ